MVARYWYCPDDIYHPMVFDDTNKLCYCISCDFNRIVITSLKSFKKEHSPNIIPIQLPILAVWIDRFKDRKDNYPMFRKDKIKEIATHLLTNV